MTSRPVGLLAALLTGAVSIQGQEAQSPAPPPAAPQAPVPALGIGGATAWYSDRRPLVVGEPVTLLVAEDWLSRDLLDERSGKARQSEGAAGGLGFGSASGRTGLSATSTRTGSERRDLGLDATLTGRVTGRDAAGWLTVEATRTLVLNGRKQFLAVKGVIRPDDVRAGNVVDASRLANAEISLDGQAVKPSQGLFGKILSALWP